MTRSGGHTPPETSKEKTMRAILLAALVAGGIGLVGTSGAMATPANGVVIDEAATATQLTDQVRHRYYHHGYRHHHHWRHRHWHRGHWRHHHRHCVHRRYYSGRRCWW